jgi:hypothetical protein
MASDCVTLTNDARFLVLPAVISCNRDCSNNRACSNNGAGSTTVLEAVMIKRTHIDQAELLQLGKMLLLIAERGKHRSTSHLQQRNQTSREQKSMSSLRHLEPF